MQFIKTKLHNKDVELMEKRGFIKNFKKYKRLYFILMPALVFQFVFGYLQLIGIVLAFNDYNIFDGIFRSPWVGFDNFIKVFSTPELLMSIKNTLVYSFFLLFVSFPFPILLALLFNELRNERFKKIVQTISYLPHFLSWITVIGLCYSLFATEGPINFVLARIFGESYEAKNILLDASYFLPVIFWSNLWKAIGWASIIFLAAIAGIDQSLYEAAKVDGCGKLKQVLHITLPGIASTTTIVFIMSFANLFNTSFELIYGFQNVFTQEATDVISTVIYRIGIQNGKYSLATAFGLSQGIISLLLIITANTVMKKVAKASIW